MQFPVIPPEIKAELFSFRTMAWKATKRLGYFAGGAAFFAAVGWLSNAPAVTDALKHVGAGDAVAGGLAAGIVWASAAIANYVKNHKLLAEPDQATTPSPAATQAPIFEAYAKLRSEGVPPEEALKRALAQATGA